MGFFVYFLFPYPPKGIPKSYVKPNGLFCHVELYLDGFIERKTALRREKRQGGFLFGSLTKGRFRWESETAGRPINHQKEVIAATSFLFF